MSDLLETEGKMRSKHGWRVVYGETMPAWERIFPTKREAEKFAREHESFGDVIFDISPVVPGEAPKSLAAAIDAGQV